MNLAPFPGWNETRDVIYTIFNVVFAQACSGASGQLSFVAFESFLLQMLQYNNEQTGYFNSFPIVVHKGFQQLSSILQNIKTF